MLEQYIKEKKSLRQKFIAGAYLFVKYWQIAVCSALFIFLFSAIKCHVSESSLIKINDTVINAASIITAIIITFLVAKIIQLRQEKLANWSEYHLLTQKVHHFRSAVLPLYNTYDFWPQGLKYDMEHKYKTLSFYDVRKVVFVDGTSLSPLAQEFVQNEGGLKNLYLQLRALFKSNPLADGTLYNREFDVPVYYDVELLELWHTFDCGSGLFYYFNHEYVNYRDAIFFNNISAMDQTGVKEHCLKIDSERYRNVPFGHRLYDLLGQQFTEDMLPRLYKLSRIINGPLPEPAKLLSKLLPAMILLGIIIPFLVSMELIPKLMTILSVSAVLSLLFYVVLTFHKTLIAELKISE